MPATAVLRSEWIKIKTLRGTVWSLAAVVLLTVGFSALANGAFGEAESDNGDFDPLFSVFIGVSPGQIAVIAFGTLALSSEYVSGGIRASLAAVPRRGAFYAAKLANVAGLALAFGLLTTFATFFLGGALLGDKALSIGDDGALRACVGGAVYLALMAIFATGLTAVLRSGMAVLSILIPFILVVSMVIGTGGAGVADYLPDRAGQQIIYADPPTSLDPWAGLAVTAAWAAAAALAGWWSLRRRDA